MSPITELIGGTKAYGWGSLAAASGFESIATVQVESGGSSLITFSSIPQTYTHLQIRYIAQKTSNGSMYIRFNGNSTNSYTNHTFQANGSTVTSDTNINANGTDTSASPNSGYFLSSIIDILDYRSTSKTKVIRQFAGADYNGSGYIAQKTGMWNNTAAISSITFTPDSTNLVQYSHFALYGIRVSL